MPSKTVEYSIHTKRDFDLWNFIFKFLMRNGFTLKTCWISYSWKAVHIFISYYQDRFGYKKSLNKKDIVLKNLLETLTRILEKKYKILLIVQKLFNNYFNKVFWNRKATKRMLLPLKKYKKDTLFRKLIHYVLVCMLHKNSSGLLSHFLADTIRQAHNHNAFLNTVKNFFSILNKHINYRLWGIKIIFKGRINGRPRARKKILNLINTISNKELLISFNEKTSFTKNGTLGVKIWIKED